MRGGNDYGQEIKRFTILTSVTSAGFVLGCTGGEGRGREGATHSSVSALEIHGTLPNDSTVHPLHYTRGSSNAKICMCPLSDCHSLWLRDGEGTICPQPGPSHEQSQCRASSHSHVWADKGKGGRSQAGRKVTESNCTANNTPHFFSFRRL